MPADIYVSCESLQSYLWALLKSAPQLWQSAWTCQCVYLCHMHSASLLVQPANKKAATMSTGPRTETPQSLGTWGWAPASEQEESLGPGAAGDGGHLQHPLTPIPERVAPASATSMGGISTDTCTCSLFKQY